MYTEIAGRGVFWPVVCGVSQESIRLQARETFSREYVSAFEVIEAEVGKTSAHERVIGSRGIQAEIFYPGRANPCGC